jgi:hypothetical protein
MSVIVQSIDVVIGKGNPAAVGMRLRGAQGSSLEDIAVFGAPDTFAGHGALVLVMLCCTQVVVRSKRCPSLSHVLLHLKLDCLFVIYSTILSHCDLSVPAYRGSCHTSVEKFSAGAGSGCLQSNILTHRGLCLWHTQTHRCRIAALGGSGGSHSNITVVGSRFGIDARESQPSPTLSNIRLYNQSCTAIMYSGIGALTLVGAHIARCLPSNPGFCRVRVSPIGIGALTLVRAHIARCLVWRRNHSHVLCA